MRIGVLQNISILQLNPHYKLKKIRGMYYGTPILIEKAYTDDKLVCTQRYIEQNGKMLLNKTKKELKNVNKLL